MTEKSASQGRYWLVMWWAGKEYITSQDFNVLILNSLFGSLSFICSFHRSPLPPTLRQPFNIQVIFLGPPMQNAI